MRGVLSAQELLIGLLDRIYPQTCLLLQTSEISRLLVFSWCLLAGTGWQVPRTDIQTRALSQTWPASPPLRDVLEVCVLILALSLLLPWLSLKVKCPSRAPVSAHFVYSWWCGLGRLEIEARWGKCATGRRRFSPRVSSGHFLPIPEIQYEPPQPPALASLSSQPQELRAKIGPASLP